MAWLLHSVLVRLNTTSHLHALSVHRPLAGCAAAHILHLLLTVYSHHVLHLVAVQFAEVHIEAIVGRAGVDSSMLDTSGDLVVHDGLLVLADDVDSELQHVLFPKLVWI